MTEYEKFLPLGSVCLLKKAKKRIMVIGYLPMVTEDNNTQVVYDYVGCLYPEGIISTEQSLLFNHSDIDKLFYMGYIDDEYKEFNKQLLESSAKHNKEENK